MTQSIKTKPQKTIQTLAKELHAMAWAYHDGGRKAAGYTGQAGDCACRAIAIATGQNYQMVYDALNHLAAAERPRRGKTRSHARTGVSTRTAHRYLDQLGWEWVPTMRIGSGCTVHLAAGELPTDRPLVVRVSRHFVALRDGVVQDTHNPARDGRRCVYGYWQPRDQAHNGGAS